MVFNQFMSTMHFIMYLIFIHQINDYVGLVNLVNWDGDVIMYRMIIKRNHLKQKNKNQSLNLVVFITCIHIEFKTNFLCTNNDLGGNNNVFDVKINIIFAVYYIMKNTTIVLLLFDIVVFLFLSMHYNLWQYIPIIMRLYFWYKNKEKQFHPSLPVFEQVNRSSRSA
eukprot:452870_1